MLFCLRMCLCNERIPHNMNFLFHGIEEPYVPTPPMVNRNPLCLGKWIHLFFSFFTRKSVAPNNGRVGCTINQNNFPLYQGILSLLKNIVKDFFLVGKLYCDKLDKIREFLTGGKAKIGEEILPNQQEEEIKDKDLRISLIHSSNYVYIRWKIDSNLIQLGSNILKMLPEDSNT